MKRIIPVHELFHKTAEQQNILMFFYHLTGCDTCNAFYGTGKKLAHTYSDVQNAKIFQQLCEKLACTKFVELLYGKKLCNSLNESRCEEAMKKVPPKRYHRKDNSLTLHVMSCCYQLHVLILKTCGLACNCRVWIWILLGSTWQNGIAATTPHKLMNDLLCKFSIMSMLFFL